MMNNARTAVITGAGQGLGRALALRFAGVGITPVLVGRTAAKLETVAAEIASLGIKALVYPMDVTDGEAIKHLAQSLSSVDILVNCAGEALIRPAEETDDSAWDRVMDINLKAPFRLCRALLPLIRKSPNGSIMNVLSKVALGGFEGVSAYTAAKTGLLGFTHSLSAELKEAEIRVVAVCPGPMDTPMRWAATPDYDRKQVIDPNVIADAILQTVSLPRGTTSGDILIQSMHFI
jgi:NAD(P)-dependent dehydrogenase (short-subunit alcohol dehydrogenase family)